MALSSRDHERAGFRTTSWSLVAAAARAPATETNDDSVTPEEVDDALEQLCSAYWYPVYSFIRRGGSSRAEAEDLTQGFFAQLLEKDYLADADRNRGRFRTFLLTAVKNFISNQRDRELAVKRGGRLTRLPLDFDEAESRFSIEPVDGQTPDAIYDRNWALALLQEVLASMELEYQSAGKGDLFEALKPHLTGQRDGGTFAEIASELDMTAGAVKVAAHRIREAYRTRLVQAVAATLRDEDDIDAERKLLLQALSSAQ